MNTLQQIPLPFFYAASGILGLVIGSFLNVVILRLPRMIEAAWSAECRAFLDMAPASGPEAQPYNLLRPGSACPRCGRRITIPENIPVISYLLLGGRCKGCNNRISMRYPLVETAVRSADAAGRVQVRHQRRGGIRLPAHLGAHFTGLYRHQP